jgi:protein-S-isoprenylcysteine O-methyltransferase Ste14
MLTFLFKRGFILPVTVTGLVPVALVFGTEAWRELSLPFVALGAIFYAAGISMLAHTTGLFAAHHGSLAPWNPPTEMVIVGPYRFVRNPMISGVYAMLIGETIAFLSPWLAGWSLLFIAGMSSHIAFQEEPLLRQRFGEAYARYCENVPRWLPRTTPYQPQKG